MRPSSYNILVPLPNSQKKLLFHGYSGAVDLVQPHVADLLLPRPSPGRGNWNGTAPETIDSLKERGYLTDKSAEEETAYAAELGRCVHRVLRKHASPGVLVIPTYSCNLRCPYCYEKPLKENGREWMETCMSRETGEAVFEAVERIGGTPGRPRSLTFYGGEPFQEKNEPLIRFLYHKAREKQFRSFSAITNGVELDAFRDLLGKDGKIGFLQITLDGPGEVHDRRRFLPDGSGTFDRIAANISMALERGVRVSVRMNIDRNNADTLGTARNGFRARGWDRTPLFRAYCSPVHTGGCRGQNGAHFASHLEMQRTVEEHLGEPAAGASPGAFLVASLTDSIRKRILAHLAQKHGLPRWRTAFCGSNMAMFMFDPFGDIYPCWEVIGQPEHRIGTYGPGAMDLDAEAVRAWHHRSVVEISRCRSCAYLFFCGGGCEAFAFRETGHLDRPHCLDFPRHFQLAAVQAYRDWEARAAQEAS